MSVGAPLGWLAVQLIRGESFGSALRTEWGVYLYMLLGTALVFGAYGLLLGKRESDLLESNRRLEELAITDGLTGLRNARYFHSRLEEEHARTLRSGVPLAVLIMDLDHFKAVNDVHGHAAGDEVLINVARTIASITRHGEMGARVGGEEFALLLPGSSGAQAREVGERLREAVEITRTAVPGGGGEPMLQVTTSVGIASTAEFPEASMHALYRAADEALYQAKREGRNRTVVAEEAAQTGSLGT